jgi:hypothetical protein
MRQQRPPGDPSALRSPVSPAPTSSPSRFRCARLAAAGVALALASGAPAYAQGGPTRVIAWNDLGMHCMDPDFSVFSILPPFNTVNAQLMSNGVLLAPGPGIEIFCEAIADANGSINTSSIGKTNFWQYAMDLFGVTLPLDVGLSGNAMPGLANIPQAMEFVAQWSWYQAEGIPLTPVDDAGELNPYPLMRVTARNGAGALLASTVTSVPVSQELDCRLCHESGGSPFARPAAGWAFDADPLRDDRLNILALHDERHLGEPLYDGALATLGLNSGGMLASVLEDDRPVLCDACHGSNALPGTGLPGIAPMTQVIHGLHGGVVDASGALLQDNPERSSCYTCHPGFETQCMRGAMGKAIGNDGQFAMTCQSCHGSFDAVSDPDRIAWFEEPDCQSCHTGSATNNSGQIRFTSVFDENGDVRVPASNLFATQQDVPDVGFDLYRFSEGHGGMQCSACHGSPHAIWPTAFDNDNVHATLLQGHAGTMTDCSTCHTGLQDNQYQGPHGMHPVTSKWATDNHKNVAETQGLNNCRACHGQDLRGTVLSLAQGPRTFNTQFGQKQLFEGSRVSCYLCHNGPNSDNPSNNTPPTVPSGSFATPADTPLALPLQGSDPNGNALTFRVISQPDHGTVGIIGNTATYYPNGEYQGPDAFTYAAWDGSADSNLGTVTIHVGDPACAGSSTLYGFGCPGSGDLLPQLSLSGCPSPGESVTLEYSQGFGGSVAYLVSGSARGTLELFPGCVLRVTPVLNVSGPIAVQGTGVGDGQFSLMATIPPGLPPTTRTYQVLQVDPGAANLVSATGGIEVRFE